MLPETHMSWTWMSCSENIRALATIRRWFGQRCWWKNAAWSHALCQYRWEHFKCWEAPATPMKTTPTRKEGLVWPYWWGVVGRVMIVDFSFQLPLLFPESTLHALHSPLWWCMECSAWRNGQTPTEPKNPEKNAGGWLPLASNKPGVWEMHRAFGFVCTWGVWELSWGFLIKGTYCPVFCFAWWCRKPCRISIDWLDPFVGNRPLNFELIVVILEDYEDFREDFKKLGLAFNSVWILHWLYLQHRDDPTENPSRIVGDVCRWVSGCFIAQST